MNELFRAVSQRLKTIFTIHAALELEAELILGHAERKAALFKRATQMDEEGLADVASELRRHAGEMDLGLVQDAPALTGPEPSGGVAGEEQTTPPNGLKVEAAPATGRKKSR